MPFAHDAGRDSSLAEPGRHGVEDFRQRWYVTSVGKCYPDAGRVSVDSRLALEVLRWAPYLRAEVKLLAPRLVVLVGGLAQRFAFGGRAPRRPGRQELGWDLGLTHRSWRCRTRRAPRPG